MTGKKVYAAGQWSGAVVSSLFVSKPREPASKAPDSPQSQVMNYVIHLMTECCVCVFLVELVKLNLKCFLDFALIGI